jgi:hypothetical protein
MISQDGFIVKGNVGSPPYGNCIGEEALDGLKDLGGDRKIDGKGGDPDNPGSPTLQRSLHPADRRAAELYILQNCLMPCLFQSSGQIEEPKGHRETFTYRIGRIDKQNAHGCNR